jgi:hypothetical protein
VICASVAFATRQGIGLIPKWLYDNGILQKVMVFRHGSRRSYAKEWYGPGVIELVGRPFNGPTVDDFLKGVDCMVFMETPFDWSFLGYCRKKGIKTAIIPDYECTPARRPFEPDRWLCCSPLDLEYFPGSPLLEIPAPPVPWRRRTRAARWLHNGGHLGLRWHKGSLEILKALHLVKSPVDFTVRAQDSAELEKALGQAGWDPRKGRHPLPGGGALAVVKGEVEYDELFRDHDAFIMAEKYNGLSLPLREARAAGMLVVTSRRFPMTQWLPNDPLIPVAGYHKARISGAYLEYDEAEVRPEDIAATIDRLWDADIAEYSLSGKEWAEGHSWERLKPRWVEALQALAGGQNG